MCSDVAAQLSLERLFPPAVTIGGESTVKAEGKFPTWPVNVEVDRDDVSVVLEKESGVLRLSTEGAAPGVVWLRMHDADSASALVPLLLEPAAVCEESEPNERATEATRISLPCVVAGRLSKSGDVDMFRIQGKAGHTIVLSVIANRVLKSPMDAVAQLLDRDGNVIEQVDDRRGMDPQIVYRCKQDGDLFLRLFAFPETPNSTIGYSGSASFVYAIRMTDGPFVDHVLPLQDVAMSELQLKGWNLDSQATAERVDSTSVTPMTSYVPGALGWQWHPNTQRAGFSEEPVGVSHVLESRDQPAEVAAVPSVLSGSLDEKGEVDVFPVQLEVGKRYRFSIDARKHGLLTDSVLTLVNPGDQSELARNDDASRNVYDSALEFTAKETGTIEVHVSDLVDGHGIRHAYSVLVERVSPTISLTVPSDRFSVAAGESTSIAVSVARRGGYSDAVQVRATGLPKGVTCEPVTSESKGASAKAVTLKLVAAENAKTQHSKIRIVAMSVNGSKDSKLEKPDGKRADSGEPGETQAPEDESGARPEWVAYHGLRDVVRVENFWLSITSKK